MEWITLDNVITALTFIGGIAGVAKIVFDLNSVYQRLNTTDELLKAKFETQWERIKKLEEDLTQSQFENRELRARIWDRVEFLERELYKENWSFLVDRGILTQEQLEKIRSIFVSS
jgi:hypothetical protein